MPSTSTFGESFQRTSPGGTRVSLSACANPCLSLSRRLDEDYIVFRGAEQEAASAHLSGKLILCLSEPLSIKHIRLHLTGISRVW